MADVTTAGPGLASRERVRADKAAGYRTFPARLPAVLSAAAGVLGILGALGAGIRATAVETARDEPLQVGVLMGHEAIVGWLVAGLALLFGASGIAWLGRSRILKLGAAAAGIAFVALTATRLSFYDSRAADWAAAALRQPDFVGYHAGFGWGAWVLLTAAIFACFALLVSALRALDVRKGLAG